MAYLSLLLVLLFGSGSVLAQSPWKQTTGPVGGNVRSVAASLDGKQVVAGFWNGSLYRMSSDDPAWTRLAGIEGLTSLTAQGNILFAQSYSGLYQSYDFGTSWVPVVRGTINTQFSSIIRGRDALYFIANDSVYRSIDAGDTWIYSGSTGQSATELGYSGEKAGESALIAANGFTGVFASSDRGATWARAEKGLPSGPVISSMVTISREGRYSVWVCVQDQGVYCTDNGGKDWDKECDGLPEYGSGYPNFTRLVEAAGKLFGVTDHSVYEYSFQSESWQKANHLLGKNIQAYGGMMYSTSADGVELSSDGGVSWNKVGTGFLFSTIQDLASSQNGVLAASHNGVFRTVNSGDEWVKTGDFYSVDLATGHGVAYAESLEGVRRSTDDGATWELANEGISEDLNHLSCVAANSTAAFAGFYDVFGFHGTSHWNSGGVYRSTNGGVSWEAANNGLSNDGFADVPINKLEAYDDVQFALAIDGLYRSTNNGEKWNKVRSIDPSEDMAVDIKRTGDLMFLATMRSMYRSTDDGQTWVPFATGLQSQLENHQSLMVVEEELYLKSYTMSGELRTYRSIGQEWVATTIPGPNGVEVTTFFQAGNTLYAGTDGRSIWTRELVSASVASDRAGRLDIAMFPNPFAAALNVSIIVPNSSSASIALYDLAGTLVFEQQDEVLQPGMNFITIAAGDLSAGSYLCRVTTKDGTAQKQVVLLK